MALYIGNDKIKRKIYIDGIAYKLKYAYSSFVKKVRLISSDNLTLRDKNGVYIMVKDGE